MHKTYYYAMCPTVVATGDGPKTLLSCSIPLNTPEVRKEDLQKAYVCMCVSQYIYTCVCARVERKSHNLEFNCLSILLHGAYFLEHQNP